ncbi:DNA-binding response regulator, OmpR family, contains REC and winged-helix (wHTH) domain [Paenibacillus sp. 1_12]|uniref:response regulator transcription factor n=1 Tax=Paenibacillus sp. 1_12 TaxID=1566278 RepID=UPI0008E7F9FD|nr:response regulator transcription factor [Paenibacillus sp. 1_12]SFL85097.1 DNA-binding response regulator, OmpR family, contains REC and winged-helix (wHTH) domain [Paenibacillus sp. 1_12]
MSKEFKHGKIMIVDDEPNIVEVIRLYLEHAGYEPIIAYRGGEVLQTVRHQQPDLVLLDVMLPDHSGFELCSRIRNETGALAHTPIIFLTAKGESIDKLRAFNLGIDDYIVKPFDPNELIARIKAVLRRTQQQNTATNALAEPDRDKLLRMGKLVIDPGQYKVTLEGKRVDLTPKEIELLYFLASNPGRVYSREDLLGYVWNFDFSGGTRTVDAHVKNLRKKLGASSDWAIQTLWGIGYSFEVMQHA